MGLYVFTLFLVCAIVGVVEMSPNELAQLTENELHSPSFRCTPGESFRVACNNCRCAPNGKMAACTFKLCLPDEDTRKVRSAHHTFPSFVHELPQIEDPSLLQRPQKKCNPGQVFKLSCNTCTCVEGGNDFFCSNINCPGKPINLDDIVCIPGQDFMDDCNTCSCNSKGTNYKCTELKCFNPPPSKVCEPGTTKEEDCNTCICTESGSGYACTKKKCDGEEEDVETCVPGSETNDGCNKCICNDHGSEYACTKNKCHDEKPATSRLCRPFSIYKELCNTCRCNAAGTKASCTSRLC